ncbi:MAG: hypothetical protein ACKVS5_01265 [Parvularculaceae bacterium]
MRIALIEILNGLLWAFAIVLSTALWRDAAPEINFAVWGLLGWVFSSAILLFTVRRRNPPQ